MVLLEGTLSDIDPLELERLRRIILAYDGDKALLELKDEELLRALGFSREQNGVNYPTVAGILMLAELPPSNGSCRPESPPFRYWRAQMCA